MPAFLALLAAQPLARQQSRDAFLEMADTERAFAARAQVVGWKQAFLEYFADDAVGFNDGAGPAKDQIRRNPDPPPGILLLWEPRFGDVAASGDLGWLTGPVTSINPARTPTTRYSTYFSIWKRQSDGTFKVVIDIGAAAPAAVEFAPGLLRANRNDRYDGADNVEAATRGLRAADDALNAALQRGPEAAYKGLLAPDGRLHRQGILPLVGEQAALEWLRGAAPYRTAMSRFTEVAQSRDLGYTWGSYSTAATQGRRGAGPSSAESGFYARVWTRTRGGAWKVSLDITQPAAP